MREKHMYLDFKTGSIFFPEDNSLNWPIMYFNVRHE